MIHLSRWTITGVTLLAARVLNTAALLPDRPVILDDRLR